jgi:prolipoprotein diacylglyceryltransferase
MICTTMNYFAFLLGLGCALGVWNLTRRAGKQQAVPALLILTAALLGARSVYALIHYHYYSQHPVEIFLLSVGGLDGPGALLGGLLAWLWLAGKDRRPIGRSLDDGTALFIPLILAAWLGCWLEGVAYGMPMPAGSALSRLDWKTPSHPHWPLPLLAALVLMALFYVLDRYLKNGPAGLYGGLILTAGLGSMLVVSFLRMDGPSPFWNGWRLDTWITLGLSLAFWLAWGWFIVNTERKLI